MRIQIKGDVTQEYDIRWECRLLSHYREEDEILIDLDIYASGDHLLPGVIRALAKADVKWLIPVPNLGDSWVLDLDVLRSTFNDISHITWLTGRRLVRPTAHEGATEIDSSQVYIWTPKNTEEKTEKTMLSAPELLPFLQQFHLDHPHHNRCGFVMMRFSPSPLHLRVFAAIKTTLAKFDLEALRADEKTYSDDLFPNIRTYMHGCSFGIAVFERITTDDFNPNVSLEVGYMMALAKPVCLLKDKYLVALHTDLVGRLYQPFDPQEPEMTVGRVVETWLRDKRIISQPT
jgi:hypothetical protein